MHELGPQDLHALASTALLSKRLKKGPPGYARPAYAPPRGLSQYLGFSEQSPRELGRSSQHRPIGPDSTPDNATRRHHQQSPTPTPATPFTRLTLASTWHRGPPGFVHFFWNSSSVYSQWYLCDIEYEGVTYTCAEQMMMAQQAALSGDTATELRIRTTPDPADQNSLGRTVFGFDHEGWQQQRYDIVLNTNFCKCSQNPGPQRALAATGEEHIAEASPYDLVWGIGYRADHPFACKRARWRGWNLLGRVLMDVREGLRSSIHATIAPLSCSAESTPTLTDFSRVLPTADGMHETSPSPPQQPRVPRLDFLCHPPSRTPCPATTSLRSPPPTAQPTYIPLPPRWYTRTWTLPYKHSRPRYESTAALPPPNAANAWRSSIQGPLGRSSPPPPWNN